MYGKYMISTALCLGMSYGMAGAQDTLRKSAPPMQFHSTLQQLDRHIKMAPVEVQPQPVEQYNIVVDRSELPADDQGKLTFDASGKAEVPFLIPDTMIIKIDPNLDRAQIDRLIEDYNFEVVEIYDKLGSMQVRADLSAFFTPQLTDNSVNDTVLRGAVAAIENFQSDPRIVSAAPDLLLRDQDVRNLLRPADIVSSTETAAGETADWGLADIEADQLWDLPHARDGAIFGVMDAGFNRHEDLVFLELLDDHRIDSHGNHVSGIACGKHNGVGSMGVIPNCFVRPRSGIFFAVEDGGGNILPFIVRFSQILNELNKFVGQYDDIRAYNVSLGYNWRSNFGINPDAPQNGQWRTIVQSQGENLISVLEILQERGVTLFSAAGNDSTGLADPIDAKFASPFNWAAITARERGIATNGVIVEAHDAAGNRAAFSNEAGDISCPGVNIFSTLAVNGAGAPSGKVYGTMSGTSMASPYCAAGAVLLQLVRPQHSGPQIVECMKASTALLDLLGKSGGAF